jgi:hypothetical protein
MDAERWKRRATWVYVLAWTFWAMWGILAVIRYEGPTDGVRYPRVVFGVLLACVVMPAFVLGMLRRAVFLRRSIPSSDPAPTPKPTSRTPSNRSA